MAAPRSLLLSNIGDRVRTLREAHGWTQRRLGEEARVSARFLAQLEAGAGNISVARLADVAAALGVAPSLLLEERDGERDAHGRPREQRPPMVALLGLRGAGKSTIGPKLAARLGLRFIELDALIEKSAGLTLGQLFELHGESYFRRLERERLAALFAEPEGAVVATGGAIVTDRESFALLKERAITVWLKARPEDHWSRVVEQGDHRPMARHPHAMAELRALLLLREPLYAAADHTVDTSRRPVAATVAALSEALAGHARAGRSRP